MQPQHVLNILSLQWELREAAQRLTDDVNESRMMVHTVMARALRSPPKRGASELRSALEQLAEESRQAH